MKWDAEAYDRVSTVQESWGRRLLEGFPCQGDEVVADAGCGSGRLTAELLLKFPKGRVYAIDRSVEMLEAAKRRLGSPGARLFFIHGDLLNVHPPEPVDLIFSNATFHWILDHTALFGNLYRWLRPGGQVLAQCGGKGNLDLTHEIAIEVSRAPELSSFFVEWKPPWNFSSPEVAGRRLGASGFIDVETELVTAPTQFADEDSFLEFVRTVPLLPFLSCIPSNELQHLFLRRYLERLLARTGGQYLLDYVRLNLRARHPG